MRFINLLMHNEQHLNATQAPAYSYVQLSKLKIQSLISLNNKKAFRMIGHSLHIGLKFISGQYVNIQDGKFNLQHLVENKYVYFKTAAKFYLFRYLICMQCRFHKR